MPGCGLCHVFNVKQVWEIHVALNLVNPVGQGIRNRNLARHALGLPRSLLACQVMSVSKLFVVHICPLYAGWGLC